MYIPGCVCRVGGICIMELEPLGVGWLDICAIRYTCSFELGCHTILVVPLSKGSSLITTFLRLPTGLCIAVTRLPEVLCMAVTLLNADDRLAGTVKAETPGSCVTTFVENKPGVGNLLKIKLC